MTDTDRQSPPANPVGADSTPLVVECLIRPDVSPISERRIDTIRSRLQILEETALVDDVELSRWPPHQPPLVEDDADRANRREWVTAFEQWADEHDCSLKPAFRRQPVPGSLLDDDDDQPVEIRVPVVTLALTTAEERSLAGVVPYTVDYGTDDAETYTVDDWLSAAEAATIPDDTYEAVPGTSTESA